MKKKFAVVLVDRANYGRLKPLMEIMRDDPRIDLQVICTGTMLLDRFGKAVDVVENDGFVVEERIFMELEGSLPGTMVKSMGLAIIELGNAFQRLAPDFVMMIGDRYEALSVAIAAVYQNICLIHIQGGEVTGSIDESTRHAITKLAHYHFPSTVRAGEYVVSMGERPETVFPLGCPSADVVSRACSVIKNGELKSAGVGPGIDFSRPYILALFHPVTTEYLTAEAQMDQLMQALRDCGHQVVLIWPNIDAGSDGISQSIRRFREINHDTPLHVYKNFSPETYIPLLRDARCLLGNSSSFIRDASFLGTPVVLVGSRQEGRQRSKAVIRVEARRDEILAALRQQISHGHYPPSKIYGEEGVSKKILEVLVELQGYQQKRLAYGEN